MKVSNELKLYRELDKLGWKYGLSGEGGDTTCDITMRDEPLLSYAIYMFEDNDEFLLHRNHSRKDGYGFFIFAETPLKSYKTISPMLRKIKSDYDKFIASEQVEPEED